MGMAEHELAVWNDELGREGSEDDKARGVICSGRWAEKGRDWPVPAQIKTHGNAAAKSAAI